MIVDVHTHCLQPEHFSEAARRADERAGYPPMQPLTPETYLKDMEAVDRAIVFGIRGGTVGVRSPNDLTAKWVAHKPEKLIGFMAIDPMESDYLDEVDRCVSELGLRGIKIYPMFGHYDPTDPTIFPLYEKAQQLGLPILSHMGTNTNPRAMLKYSMPLLVDEIAQAFPELKFVIAHLATKVDPFVKTIF